MDIAPGDETADEIYRAQASLPPEDSGNHSNSGATRGGDDHRISSSPIAKATSVPLNSDSHASGEISTPIRTGAICANSIGSGASYSSGDISKNISANKSSPSDKKRSKDMSRTRSRSSSSSSNSSSIESTSNPSEAKPSPHVSTASDDFQTPLRNRGNSATKHRRPPTSAQPKASTPLRSQKRNSVPTPQRFASSAPPRRTAPPKSPLLTSSGDAATSIRNGAGAGNSANDGDVDSGADAQIGNANPGSTTPDGRAAACAYCGALRASPGVFLTVCARCNLDAYCSARCKKEHWSRGHREKCQGAKSGIKQRDDDVALNAAAAAAAASSSTFDEGDGEGEPKQYWDAAQHKWTPQLPTRASSSRYPSNMRDRSTTHKFNRQASNASAAPAPKQYWDSNANAWTTVRPLRHPSNAKLRSATAPPRRSQSGAVPNASAARGRPSNSSGGGGRRGSNDGSSHDNDSVEPTTNEPQQPAPPAEPPRKKRAYTSPESGMPLRCSQIAKEYERVWTLLGETPNGQLRTPNIARQVIFK